VALLDCRYLSWRCVSRAAGQRAASSGTDSASRSSASARRLASRWATRRTGGCSFPSGSATRTKPSLAASGADRRSSTRGGLVPCGLLVRVARDCCAAKLSTPCSGLDEALPMAPSPRPLGKVARRWRRESGVLAGHRPVQRMRCHCRSEVTTRWQRSLTVSVQVRGLRDCLLPLLPLSGVRGDTYMTTCMYTSVVRPRGNNRGRCTGPYLLT